MAFVVVVILLVNCLIIMARVIHQLKRPPVEEDYEQLQTEKSLLEKTVLDQNEEIVELQLRIKEFEDQMAQAAAEALENSAETAETGEADSQSA